MLRIAVQTAEPIGVDFFSQFFPRATPGLSASIKYYDKRLKSSF